MVMGRDEIENRFGSHPPTSVTAHKHETVKKGFISFAEFLDDILPDGRAKSTAFTQLQQASMWSNFAVAEMAPVAKPRTYRVTDDSDSNTK